MITGSCLCGTVSWQFDGKMGSMTHCHCSMCRKAHGAPFATYVDTETEHFSWLSGEDCIVPYAASPEYVRAFCGNCGSVVSWSTGKESIAIPVGCLDNDPGIRPTEHIFVDSKAPWHVIEDELPKFDAYEHLDDGPVIPQPEIGDASEGVLRGSCLCDDVAYEVRKPFVLVHSCHCLRCRKARAAAHTTNGLTTIDAVVFVRGEDKLATYKLPTARFFSQTFCKRCGSPMPRLDPDRNIAVVPFGSLDDDPGRGADDHIFTGSMAQWYTITDDLPRFEEGPE